MSTALMFLIFPVAFWYGWGDEMVADIRWRRERRRTRRAWSDISALDDA